MIPPKVAYKNGKSVSVRTAEKPAPKHGAGCPKNGRLKFTHRQINSLPPLASLRTVARVLGISIGTAKQWTNKKQTHRLPYQVDTSYRYKNGLYVIRRDTLITWLTDTGRYEPRKKV